MTAPALPRAVRRAIPNPLRRSAEFVRRVAATPAGAYGLVVVTVSSSSPYSHQHLSPMIRPPSKYPVDSRGRPQPTGSAPISWDVTSSRDS